MLTPRGWWFFVVTLALVGLGLAAGAAMVTLIAFTLLSWFLGQRALFVWRLRRAHGHLRLERTLADERGPVPSLWARLPVNVRLTLYCNRQVSLSYVRMIERVPALARHLGGGHFAEGTLARDQPLEMAYQIDCPSPGLLRFEGVKLVFADLQGFFVQQTFLHEVMTVRVLPALADARGHIPAVKRHNLLPLLGSHPHRRPGSGSDLLQLRDYWPGDPPKMIAWKASARRDRLMTKEFESEVPIRCTLFVDTSNSVRVGGLGSNALARVVEIAAAVAQANAAAKDLTGLCLFDEAGVRQLVRPGRGSKHLVRLTNLLAEAASLFPQSDQAPLARLLPLAYGVLQDLYPEYLDRGLNSLPFWLPFWAPQPWYTIPGPRWKARWWWAWPVVAVVRLFLVEIRPWLLLGNLWGAFAPRMYRWRKQTAAVLSVRYDLGPGGLALLMEDDNYCRHFVQRFLVEHQIPCPLPYYDEAGRYLFGAPAKIDVLAGALMHAVLRGRDNELFVLLVDLLETGPRLEKLLRAVRLALARHHRVAVICPWPPGVEVPARQKPGTQPAAEESLPGNLQEMLNRASRLRFYQALTQVRDAFAPLGVPVLCAAEDEAVGLVLKRMQDLAARQRGYR
jgi:uncharacterized protein (DUF58 family)